MSILSQTLAALGHIGGFMLLEQLDFLGTTLRHGVKDVHVLPSVTSPSL